MSRALVVCLGFALFSFAGSASAQSYCGDGVVNAGEQCDDLGTISGDGCDQSCVIEPGWRCDGEPSICSFCGNGELEGDETCDPASSCPLSCDDGDPCTADTRVGSPSSCDVLCVHAPIDVCGGLEGCCPQGCTADLDGDCPAICGNGVLEPDETCDPASSCPSSCDDNNACTIDTLTGSATTCDVTCSHGVITVCSSDDGCCPSGCTAATDADCAAACGNGVVEPGEDCDDANLVGGDGCDASCQREPGYDCAGVPSVCQRCGNGLIEGTEACDDGNVVVGDGCDPFCEEEPDLTCGLFGGPCAFAGQTPANAVTSPEEQNGCPVPTLEQCQDNAYLEDNPCGMLQAQNEWTCSTMLQTLGEADDVPLDLSIIAYNLEPLGIDDEVRKYPREPLHEQGLVYVPDLYSVTSQAAAKNFLPSEPVIGVDIYASWDNGPEVDSCAEYAYEKFYDQTVFERMVGNSQHDHREVFEIAYGPDNNDEAIGSRHLNDPLLRGFDGRPYGWLFAGESRPKNAFFMLPVQASLPGEQPVTGAPSLAVALTAYHPFGLLLLSMIANNYGEVQPTWAWHREMSETLSVEGEPSLGFVAPTLPHPFDPGGTFAVQGAEEVEGAELTGMVPDNDGPPLRRYLDAELNEMFDLQRRMLQLVRDWALLDILFEGSGWTIGDLTDPPAPEDALFAASVFNERVSEQALTGYVTGPLNPTDPPSFPAHVVTTTGAPVPAIIDESTARARILEELAGLYDQASELGCLNEGLTPCDWSPKHFTSAVLHRFAGYRELVYKLCNEHVPGGLFSLVKNLDIPVVDEPPGPLAFFNCTIETGPTLTASEFEGLFDQVEHCREQRQLYLEAKATLEAQAALEEAQARIQAVPELYDPATHEIREPGIGDGGGEQKGNNFFKLHYDYEYGFDLDFLDEECNLELFAGGHYFTDVEVGPTPFTVTLEIVDVLAEVSTEDRALDIHARLIGLDLFTPVHESWDVTSTEHNFSFADDGNRSTDEGAEASLTIFIGPIPLQLTIGVAGSAGVEASADGDGTVDGFVKGFGLLGDVSQNDCPGAGFRIGARAYTHIDAYAEAIINLGLAEGGVRGELLIVDAEAKFGADADLSFDPSPPDPLEFPKSLQFGVSAKLQARVHTLDGDIKLYGRLGPCPLCWKGEKTLVAWDGYHLDRVLFDQDYDIYLGDLLDAIGRDG